MDAGGILRCGPSRSGKGSLEIGRAIGEGKTLDPRHGAIDDVRVFRGALGAGQVRQVMAGRT